MSSFESLRVASYNIRKAVGLDWKRDPLRILDVLSEMDADIIALQEVDRRFSSKQGTLPIDVLENKHNYKFVDVATNHLSHGWHGNGILYNQESLSLLSSARIALPNLEPRGAVVAVFSSLEGVAFQVIATHLSLVGYMRKKQVSALKQYIETQNHQYPTVIAGDFNEWRTYGKACQTFGANYNILTPGSSFHSTSPKLSLDRFVLKGELEAQNIMVHNTKRSKKASDHLPIYIDINLKD